MPDWEQIVREFGPVVWKAASRLLAIEADIADCFQRTFLSAVELVQAKPVRDWGAFLKRVATARALEQLRSRYRDAARSGAMPDELPPDPSCPDPAELVADQCRGMRESGCGGVDLLAYRATDAEPMALVRAARHALPDRALIVAGSVNAVDRIHALAEAGVDAFTIGSAVLDRSFAPALSSTAGQIGSVLAACRTAPRFAA